MDAAVTINRSFFFFLRFKEIETFNARNYLESKLTHETNLSILDLELSRWLSALWVTSMDLIVKKKSPIVAPVNKMMRGF
ncbi:unnamed protein product [Rhizophagus irregularis]|nr:unnamed protein product [Rhizophagus irregularis]